MIRVSVVSTKEIFKLIIKIVLFIVILVVIIGIIRYSKRNFEKTSIDTNKYLSYITDEITVMGNLELNNKLSLNPEIILDSEFRASKAITSRNMDSLELSNYDEEENSKANIVNENESLNQSTEKVNGENLGEIKEVNTGVQTEVIKSTYKETYNYSVNGVKIKNETNFNLDELQLSTDNVNTDNKNVIIFHTHTCESYTQTENCRYEESGNYRTTNVEYSVSKVGDELGKYLTNYGFNVIHNKTYHDYPAYNGSYGRSLKTVSDILSKNKANIIIDLHRDAMNDETYAPKVRIGDEYVSQIMFVIGTDGSGLKHDNWKQNLEFAIKVQQKGNELYPGLFKPIILRNARYNQNLSSEAVIVEFGATGNTLEEATGASKYLAKVLSEI